MEELKQSQNIRILYSFQDLESNWNGNGAEPFNPNLIERCRQLVMTLERQPQIFPTARQSIQLEYERIDAGYLELEIFESTIHVYQHIPGDDEIEKDINESSVNHVVKAFYG